ncbi:MAG: hypothetical protein MUE82_11550, partial [Chloroflexi bacterium]|nr:hypothetical protein [Chloroflexota bacterium]
DAIDAVLLDVDDDPAVRIMLADNRTHDRGRDDDAALAVLLTELANAGGLAGTAYDRDDVDELLRVTGRLGAETTRFLAGYGEPAPAEAAPGIDPGMFVTVAFTMSPEDRDVVMDGIRAAQAATGGTQPEALLTIVREWSRVQRDLLSDHGGDA